MKNDKNENHKTLKSGMWYIVSNFLIRGINFLVMPIFTRLLSKEEYGLYSNFISWQGILIILTTFNVKSTLISAIYDYKEKMQQYIFSILVLSSCSSIIWMIVLNFLQSYIEEFFNLKINYINIMFMYIIFYVAIELFQEYQRFQYKYKLQVFISVLTAVSATVLSLVFVLCYPDRLMGRIFGGALPTILIGFCLYVLFAVKSIQIDIEYWKYAIKICLPYIPHLLSLTILSSTDRIMITKICGSSYTALYSLAYQCSYIASIILSSMNTAYAPWLAECLDKKDYERVRIFSKIYIGIVAICVMGVMIIAPEILLILGGKNYLSAKYIMPPIAMGCLCQFIYTMFVNVEQIKRKTVGMAFASMLAAGLNLILNFIFIPKFGYIAAAYTTLLGYICLLLIHMWMVKKMNMSKVYSYRFIFVLILGVGVFTMGMSLFYRSDMLRYVIAIIYFLALLIFVYKFRNSISIFLKKI